MSSSDDHQEGDADQERLRGGQIDQDRRGHWRGCDAIFKGQSSLGGGKKTVLYELKPC